jgi:hypothetical protein
MSRPMSEIDAIAEMANILFDISAEERARALAYLTARFVPGSEREVDALYAASRAIRDGVKP